MAVLGNLAVAVEVVQKHELLRQCVLIRRHLAPEEHQFRVAIALWEVAENLVVSAVLFENVNYVLDRARLADALGNRARRLVFAGGERRLSGS